MQNNLNRGRFKLLFDHERIPLLEGIVGTEIPGVSLSLLSIPVGKGMKVWKPGDEIEFNDLPIRFIVDKYLLNWETILNWIYENKGLKTGIINDVNVSATLQLCGDNGVVYRELKFHGLIPMELDNIELLVDGDDTEFLVSTATFKFQYVELLPIREELNC